MTSNDHPPHAYQNLLNFPEYQNFKYRFDFYSIIVLITLIYFIPSFYCTIKMVLYYRKTNTQTNSSGIHPFVFKSFIQMQVWNSANIVFDFLLVRIPSTTLVTSFCTSLRPGNFAPLFVAGLYFTFYLSQMFTVLFCFMRVLILFSPRNHNQLCTMSFLFWSPAAYVLSSVTSFSHVVSDLVCLQFDVPYQDGAIAISSSFTFGNKALNVGHLIFSTTIVLGIVTSTVAMLIKLRHRKLMSTTSRKFHRSKAEATLTVTMFIIMIPAFFAQILSIGSLTGWKYYSYILVARPILIDSRVNIVSCYFYLTHPIFKQEPNSTVTVRSLNTTTY